MCKVITYKVNGDVHHTLELSIDEALVLTEDMPQNRYSIEVFDAFLQ